MRPAYVKSAITEDKDERILILAPTGRDADLTSAFLLEAEMHPRICRGMRELVQHVEEGCGAIILAEETLGISSVQLLTELLAKQPSWSEIPVCIITSGGEATGDALRRLTFFSAAANVTILERPFRPATLVNTLAVALRSRRRQYQVRDLLEERAALAQRFRLMADAMPQKIFTATPRGEVDYFNQQWMQFTGLGFDDIKEWGWIHFVHPDDLQETSHRWQSCLETGVPLEMEHRFRGQDSIYRWHLSRACAVRNAEGEILLWIGSNTDIDDQKQAATNLEALIRERTASLSETNAQLEAFCYTISHDLRAPLRAQQGFSNAILEEYGHVLDETGREYATRIRQAAVRLDELVNDLLAFSRISRVDLSLNDVNLRKLILDVNEEMKAEAQATNAYVYIDNFLFRVRAHPLTLRTAITNLLSNALKFRKPNVPPEIRIKAEERGTMVRLWVEDNGIGIAPQHQHQIFGVFHRLHKTGDYPGTGVGLAIVQKGIERMGGRVGIESEEGTGCRFWIELQKAADA